MLRNPTQRILRLIRLCLALAPTVLLPQGAHAAYAINADGTVTDTITGLIWDRCPLGRSTTTTACDTGSATTYSWPSALIAVSTSNTASHLGHNDWRLPNVTELESLVKIDSASIPAIDTTTFPIMSADDGGGMYRYWSSTSRADVPAGAWFIRFDYGGVMTGDKTSAYFVRLVRGGQTHAAFDGLNPPVNGTCGIDHNTGPTPLLESPPDLYLCDTGTASGVTAGTATYTWSCAGTNGGATVSCQAPRGYTVTPSAGANGTVSPNSAQVVAYNATPSFTVTPASGYAASVGGTCGGTLTGTTYTTNAVTADCAVTASFALNTSYSAPAPGSGGTVGTNLSGGGGTCGFASVGYQSAASAGGTPPAGYTFPHGVAVFTASGCTPGGTIVVTLTYPSPLPSGTRFFKYGPATAGASPTWYEHPAIISADRLSITYSVTDNGQGDGDNTGGVIADPAGAAVPAPAPTGAGVTAVPTLGEWALLLLTGMLAWLGLGALPKRMA